MDPKKPFVKIVPASTYHRGPYEICAVSDKSASQRPIYGVQGEKNESGVQTKLGEIDQELVKAYKEVIIPYIKENFDGISPSEFFFGDVKKGIKPFSYKIGVNGLDLDINDPAEKPEEFLKYIMARHAPVVTGDGYANGPMVVLIEPDKIAKNNIKKADRKLDAQIILRGMTPFELRKFSRLIHGASLSHTSDEELKASMIEYVESNFDDFLLSYNSTDRETRNLIYDMIENSIFTKDVFGNYYPTTEPTLKFVSMDDVVRHFNIGENKEKVEYWKQLLRSKLSPEPEVKAKKGKEV